ncbi:MAG TPA: HAMP domain-containing sensor histidine kinase [Candidatus Polarisedimenticolaceae bacterium]|nr:HAMP domain-containing sensor histidine kinase [Candidatus Polarisedimenticolaceae bacterium]
MSRWSLAGRLRLLVALGTAVVLVVVVVTAYRTFRAAYVGQLDRILQVMATGVASVAARAATATGLDGEVQAIVASPWRGPGNEVRVWLDGESRDLVAGVASARRELIGSDPSTFPPPAIGEARYFDLDHKQRSFRAVWLRRQADRGVINVLILHPANYEQRRLRSLATTLAATSGLVLLLAIGLATPLARLAFRPLRPLVERLGAITPTAPRALLDGAPGAPVELTPLVRAIDELVARFSATIERQRALVAEASHQLRTPLAIARSTLEVSEGDAPSGQVSRELLEELTRMEHLVEQLVLLARVETGPLSDPVEQLRLDAVLEELAASYRAKADTHGIRIDCRQLAPCEIDGDEVLLRALFGALLDNAMQYGPAGGTVRVTLEQGPAGQCTATVQDDGGGIPAVALACLFDRFYRDDSTRAQNPAGAGLGLSIAREIARRHGGEVWATSVPGRRTSFHVRLPMRG